MKKRFKGKDVIVMACSDCNTKCKHCYINYKGNMNEEQLNSLVNKFVQSYNTSINGTEVIIHLEYFNALKKVG